MTSNDLLSYSIMFNGDRAIQQVHYPSLASAKLEKVVLPPITSYVKLTENNLNSLNSYLLRTQAASLPPSLTTSSLALDLALSSPRMAARVPSEVAETPEKKRRQRWGPSCDNCRFRKVKCNAEVIMLSRNFVGAEDVEELRLLLPHQREQVLAGESVQIPSNFVLVLSKNKLIKFKPCLSCATKGLACCFSKGFTKEDIIHSKRSESGADAVQVEAAPAVTVSSGVKRPRETTQDAEPSAKSNCRKSSCSACRKRKVKCEMKNSQDKCLGCAKKNVICSLSC